MQGHGGLGVLFATTQHTVKLCPENASNLMQLTLETLQDQNKVLEVQLMDQQNRLRVVEQTNEKLITANEDMDLNRRALKLENTDLMQSLEVERTANNLLQEQNNDQKQRINALLHKNELFKDSYTALQQSLTNEAKKTAQLVRNMETNNGSLQKTCSTLSIQVKMLTSENKKLLAVHDEMTKELKQLKEEKSNSTALATTPFHAMTGLWPPRQAQFLRLAGCKSCNQTFVVSKTYTGVNPTCPQCIRKI